MAVLGSGEKGHTRSRIERAIFSRAETAKGHLLALFSILVSQWSGNGVKGPWNKPERCLWREDLCRAKPLTQ